MYFLRHYLSIFYFQNDAGKIAVNIESNNIGDVFICVDKNCDKMQYLKNAYSYELNQQNPLFYNGAIDDIEFIFNNNNNNIEAISIFYNLDKLFYLSKDDLKNIEINEIDFNGSIKYASKISLNKANDKTKFQKFAVYLESIFYNWYFYLFSYILILFYFLKYKQRFDFEIKYGILWVLALAFILRLSHINYIPLWNDELYTFCYISNLGESFNLKRTFLDAGNPPIYFLLSNIWLKFFNQNLFLIRLLPCLIGVFQVYSIYFIIDKILNKKTALIAAFLSSINIFLILQSNEIRSYILSMTLVLWSGYYFYKLTKDFSNRNLLCYSIISILLINLHYYCIFYVFANFVLGIFIFKNNRVKFLAANILSFATFLPYFLLVVLKQSFVNDFNSWIPKPSIDVFLNHIKFYFGNIFFFLLTILFVFFVYNRAQKPQKELIFYNCFIISFVFVFALLVSLLIKPVLFERYFCIFIPLFIINTSVFLSFDYKYKLQPIIILIVFLSSISFPKYENFNLFDNINLMMKYSYLDSKNNNEYQSYFIVPDKIEYVKYFPYINKKQVIILESKDLNNPNSLDNILEKIDKTNARKILYFPELPFGYVYKKFDNIKAKKIETTLMRIYKVYID